MPPPEQALIAVAVISCLEFIEFVAVRTEAFQVFSPKFIWRLIFWAGPAIFLFLTIRYLPYMHSEDDPQVRNLTFLAFLVVWRPRTLVANPAGLASYALYGLLKNYIPWVQVSKVTWSRKVGNRNSWTLNSYPIVVIGRDGTRIKFTVFQEHSGEFLDLLRHHIPADAFAPGLYNSRP